MTLNLHLGETFDLTRDGEPVILKNRKAQALLIYLTLTGKPQSRDHLATLLWPDRFDDQARASLRQALFALRKAVGEDIIAGDDTLVVAEESIAIEAPGFDYLIRFSSGSPEFDAWLIQDRASRNKSLSENLAAQARAFEAAGDEGSAASAWYKVIKIDPYNENWQRALMRALAEDGRRGEALEAYAEFSERLMRDLEAVPEAETSRLASDMRAGKSASPMMAQFRSGGTIRNQIHALIAPFDDLGGGDLAGFFAHELPSEIAQRAQSLALNVTATTIQSNKEGDAALLAEANEKGAALIVNGSARQIADKTRISARIWRTSDGKPLWSDDQILDEVQAFEGIGKFANRVTSRVSRELSSFYTLDEMLAALDQNLDNEQEFRNVFGNLLWFGFFVEHNRRHMAKLLPLLERVAERFPNSVDVLGWLAMSRFHLAHFSDGKDRVEVYERAWIEIERVAAIDSGNSLTQSAQIIFSTWTGRFAEAEAAYDAAQRSENPNHALDALYAVALLFQGEIEPARERLIAALETERGTPLLVYRYAFLALADFIEGKDEEALKWSNRSLEITTEFFLGHLLKIASLSRLGREEEASVAVQNFKLAYEDPTICEFGFLPFTDSETKELLFDSLRAAGVPEKR